MWDESQPPLEESANTFEHLEGREGLEGAQGWGGGRRLSFSPDGGLRSARPAVGPSSFGSSSWGPCTSSHQDGAGGYRELPQNFLLASARPDAAPRATRKWGPARAPQGAPCAVLWAGTGQAAGASNVGRKAK
ncbi:unnamed protein product, partial [Prorocentrum cordatum]